MTWTGEDVIVHQLTEVDYRVINSMAANQQTLNLKSLMKQDYRSGVTGEYLFAKRFPEAIRSKKEDVYAYDFEMNGYLIDVKTRTINVSYIPSTFQMWILAYVKEHTKADFLYFCATNLDRNLAYEVAYMDTKTFFEMGTFIPKGTLCPPMPYPAQKDQYRMEFGQMKPISELDAIFINPRV